MKTPRPAQSSDGGSELCVSSCETCVVLSRWRIRMIMQPISSRLEAAMGQNNKARDPYLVKSVVHASQLLSAFRSSGEALPLREVAGRSGLPKSMAFRILYTLERCGMVDKVGENLYRSSLRPFRQKLHRLGYAAQGTDYQFSKDVSTSLQRAAAAEGIELISLDNR